LRDFGREIEHVGSTRRAEVFLLDLETAAGIVFQVRMITAKAVVAHFVGTGAEIGNENAGVLPALATHNLAAGKGVYPTEPGASGEFRIDPARLQCAKICGSEVAANAARPTVLLKTEWSDQWRCTVPWLQILVVDIAVARIHFSPPAGRRVQTSKRFGHGCCKPTVSNASVELWKVMGGGVARRKVRH
jgi:hypothetical protein